MLDDRQSLARGIALVVGSAFAFSLMAIFVNLTGDIPTMEQVFVRNIVLLVLILPVLRKRHISLQMRWEDQPALFARSICGFAGVALSFYGYSHASQGEIAMLVRLSPFLITLLAVVFLHEKLRPVQIPALIIAFVGAAFVLRPRFDADILPLAAAFVAALLTGVAYTALRYLKGRVDGMVVILHLTVFSIIGAIPFMVGNFVVPDAKELLGLILIGIFAYLGQVGITYGYRAAPASQVSVFDNFSIVFSSLLGWLILGETLPAGTLLGGALIVLAAVLIFVDGIRAERESADEIQNL